LEEVKKVKKEIEKNGLELENTNSGRNGKPNQGIFPTTKIPKTPQGPFSGKVFGEVKFRELSGINH